MDLRAGQYSSGEETFLHYQISNPDRPAHRCSGPATPFIQQHKAEASREEAGETLAWMEEC
jgi:hypothetical protein